MIEIKNKIEPCLLCYYLGVLFKITNEHPDHILMHGVPQLWLLKCFYHLSQFICVCCDWPYQKSEPTEYHALNDIGFTDGKTVPLIIL